jgi:hypothetical protein
MYGVLQAAAHYNVAYHEVAARFAAAGVAQGVLRMMLHSYIKVCIQARNFWSDGRKLL